MCLNQGLDPAYFRFFRHRKKVSIKVLIDVSTRAGRKKTKYVKNRKQKNSPLNVNGDDYSRMAICHELNVSLIMAPDHTKHNSDSSV